MLSTCSRAKNQWRLWFGSWWNWRRRSYLSTGTRAGAPAGPLPQLPEASGLQLPVLHQGLRQAQPAGETQQNPHRSEVVSCCHSGYLLAASEDIWLVSGGVVNSSSGVSCIRGHFTRRQSHWNQPPVIMSASCWATSLKRYALCLSSTADLHTQPAGSDMTSLPLRHHWNQQPLSIHNASPLFDQSWEMLILTLSSYSRLFPLSPLRTLTSSNIDARLCFLRRMLAVAWMGVKWQSSMSSEEPNSQFRGNKYLPTPAF